MGIQKCPRCEINFMRDGEKYCSVCMKEVKKQNIQDNLDEDVDICAECGEHPALAGEELCKACLLDSKLMALKNAVDSRSSAIDDPVEDEVEIIPLDLVDEGDELDADELDLEDLNILEDEIDDFYDEDEEQEDDDADRD